MVKFQQIFVGCPFLRAIRRNYDKLKYDLERETPLHIILADTTAISSTDYDFGDAILNSQTLVAQEETACVPSCVSPGSSDLALSQNRPAAWDVKPLSRPAPPQPEARRG
jgi:hypothetical protein